MPQYETDERTKTIFRFDESDSVKRWLSVNDGVMGGLSQSSLLFTAEGIAVFQGNVSLENRGGFASVRSRPMDLAMGGYDGVVLRVRGDGHRYQLRLRTSDRFDGVAYQARFEPEAYDWCTVQIRFADCAPTFRGRHVPGVPRLDSGLIQQIGLLIADGQQGPFRLGIAWIQVYKDPDAS